LLGLADIEECRGPSLRRAIPRSFVQDDTGNQDDSFCWPRGTTELPLHDS